MAVLAVGAVARDATSYHTEQNACTITLLTSVMLSLFAAQWLTGGGAEERSRVGRGFNPLVAKRCYSERKLAGPRPSFCPSRPRQNPTRASGDVRGDFPMPAPSVSCSVLALGTYSPPPDSLTSPRRHTYSPEAPHTAARTRTYILYLPSGAQARRMLTYSAKTHIH